MKPEDECLVLFLLLHGTGVWSRDTAAARWWQTTRKKVSGTPFRYYKEQGLFKSVEHNVTLGTRYELTQKALDRLQELGVET